MTSTSSSSPSSYNKPVCNCPMASAQRQGDTGSEYFSTQFASNWQTNPDGQAFKGVRYYGGYCEHEMATIVHRGEINQAFPNGIPTDIPTPLPPSNSLIKSTYVT